MFEPPRCPNRSCPHHKHPVGVFWRRRGTYKPKCRPRPVPRFKCRHCGKGFSRQTFRADYRDHKPHLNAKLLDLLASGVGLRQASRNLKLSLRATELKFRKISKHLRHFNNNLSPEIDEAAVFQFDELETFEGRRGARPLTVPIMIERESRFVIWANSAPIRPRGRMSKARKKAIAADERRFGPRRDRSRRSIEQVFRRAARAANGEVWLQTDEKSTYPNLARQAFGEERLTHTRTNSKLPRTTWNPLFPINHTEAMARDLMGRLRRESWLVSKRGWCLDLHLQLFAAYRNFVRRRFNYDEQSPAQMLGCAPRRMSPGELLSWRQDWRERSIHPLSDGRLSIADRVQVAA